MLGILLIGLHILPHLMFITTLYVVFIITICQMRKWGFKKKSEITKVTHLVHGDAYDPFFWGGGVTFTLDNRKLLN